MVGCTAGTVAKESDVGPFVFEGTSVNVVEAWEFARAPFAVGNVAFPALLLDAGACVTVVVAILLLLSRVAWTVATSEMVGFGKLCQR